MQGYAPYSCFGAKPSLEDGIFRYNYFCSLAVIDVDFLIVADCDITFLVNFNFCSGGIGRQGRVPRTLSVLDPSLDGGVSPLWILGFCGRLLQ